jgi:hypothetical protein
VHVKTPRASLARVCTLSLVALCLTTQLSGFAHLALVPHVACAEHGELVEADGRRQAATPSGVASNVEVAAVSSEPRVEPSGSHAHDHCICTAVRRTPARVSRASAGPELRAVRPPSLLATREIPSAPALAPLDVAPKSSPPSV